MIKYDTIGNREKGERVVEPIIHKFRSTLIGGFNRRDVLDYIEQTAKESNQKISGLTQQLEETRREKEDLASALTGLRSQSGDLAEQEARVRASLEESTRTLTRVRGELQVTQGQLTIAKKELADLQAKVAQLEPMAQRYEALKDRVATVELDAHRKAQVTLDEAETQIEQLKEDAAHWVDQISGSYESIRDQVKACAQTAEAAYHAFEAAEADYQALLHRVEGVRRESGVGVQ